MRSIRKISVLLILGMMGLSSHVVSAAVTKTKAPPVVAQHVTYVVKRGDTLSKILFNMGIGTPSSPHRLYGKHGWIKKTQKLNPGITQWESLAVDQTITLAYPAPQPSRETPKPVAEPPSQPAPSMPEMSHESMPPPPAEVEAKAVEVSFMERNTPEFAELFKNLKKATPSAYLGVRAGFSLVKPEMGLTAKIRSYGFLAEVRSGALNGLRFLYETTPKVTLAHPTYKESFAYDRALLGWAFEWRSPFLFDLIHFTPRLGRYSVDAVPGPNERLRIAGAPSFGTEIDAEFARYFYVVRFWGATDFPIAVPKQKYQTTSTRAGVDVYLKGGGFTLFDAKVSPSYLIFTSFDQLKITDKQKPDFIQLVKPLAGFGYTININ